MLALLPVFAWVALANVVLMRLLVPGTGRGWWIEAIALSALAAVALAPWWPQGVAGALPGFLAMLAFAASAQAAAEADLHAERSAPAWLRHLHAIGAVAGGILAFVLLAAGTELGAAGALRAAVAFSLAFALLVSAWPAARQRMDDAAPSHLWARRWTAALWTGMAALALTGLSGWLA